MYAVCMYVFMCVYVFMVVCMCVCMYVCMYACMYVAHGEHHDVKFTNSNSVLVFSVCPDDINRVSHT